MKAIRNLTVPWEYGVHIRPATKIAKLLKKFEAEVHIKINGGKYNAKKVIELLAMEAYYGEKLTVEAKGSDAEEAITKLTILFDEEDDQELGAY